MVIPGTDHGDENSGVGGPIPTFTLAEIHTAVRDAHALGAIGFDAAKHLLL